MSAQEITYAHTNIIEALREAFKSPAGPEWLTIHQIKWRLSNAKLAVDKTPLERWLNQMVASGDLATKTENGKTLYHPVIAAAGTLPKDKLREKKTFAPPKRTSPTPPTNGTSALKDDKMPRDLPLWFIKYRQDKESELAAKNRRIHELEMAIMQHKTEQSRALSIYGSPNALQELTEQVSLSPKFVDLTPDEHRYVASVGLASGLNPEFHLHAWKQNKRVKDDSGNWKTVKVLSILPDYKGLMASVDDPIMTDERRLTKDEMKARGIPQEAIDEGAIAYEFTVTRLKQAIMAKQAGIPYTPIRGYGWWEAMKDEEKWDKNQKKYVATGKRIANDTPNARDGEWVAKKRAIRDAFNQVADLRLKFVQVEGAEVVEDEWQFVGDPEAIEGEYTINAATGEVTPQPTEPTVSVPKQSDKSEAVDNHKNNSETPENAPQSTTEADSDDHWWYINDKRQAFWTANNTAGRTDEDVARRWNIPPSKANNHEAQEWADATQKFSNVGEAMADLMTREKENAEAS